MLFNTVAVAALAFATLAQAVNYTVIVGKDNQNVFDPTSLSDVKAGDFIDFLFVSKAHGVGRSTFADPCTQNAETPQINSGFQEIAANASEYKQYTVQITNGTAPQWFYCTRVAHCKAGMVFAVNPNANRTFAAFQANAVGNTTTTPNPGTPAGNGTTPATGGGDQTNTGTTNPPGSGALSVTASRATVLAVLGLVAGLTL